MAKRIMLLKSLSDKDLLTKTKELVRTERENTLNVLRHLREVEKRLLFADIGYQSLFEYCVRELKYSEGAAQRRISSMRLLASMPDIVNKVESGKLTLSSLAKAQTFFKQEKTESVAAKKAVMAALENKSAREVERELISRSSAPQNLTPEKLRAVSENHSELKILIDKEFLSEIDELRNLLAHSLPNATIKDVLVASVRRTLRSLRIRAPRKPLPPTPAEENPTIQKPTSAKRSRYIPQETRRQVWHRDAGQCTYVRDGQRCTSKFGLELDHIHPHALGGMNKPENLRLRCKAHNQLAAMQIFGKENLKAFVERLR